MILELKSLKGQTVDYNEVYEAFKQFDNQDLMAVSVEFVEAPIEYADAESAGIQLVPDIDEVLESANNLYKEVVDAALYPIDEVVDIATDSVVAITDTVLDGTADIIDSTGNMLSKGKGPIIAIAAAAGVVLLVFILMKTKSSTSSGGVVYAS